MAVTSTSFNLTIARPSFLLFHLYLPIKAASSSTSFIPSTLTSPLSPLHNMPLVQSGLGAFLQRSSSTPPKNSNDTNMDPTKKRKSASPSKPSNTPTKQAKFTNTPSSALPPIAKTKLSSWLPESWKAPLVHSLNREYFKKLDTFVTQERATKTIYPPEELVFSAFNACPFQNVKVVIIGQDPYHGPGQAHGMCFSVQKGVRIPPSLINIYKELKDDIPDFRIPNHGYLEHWANQGVLLLNATLTVQQANPTSHTKMGWETFTDDVIKAINENKKNIVFLLWGRYAQQKGSCIDKSKHHVLTAAHPSPLSRTGWFGSKHFSKTNTFLKSIGAKEINWHLDQ